MHELYKKGWLFLFNNLFFIKRRTCLSSLKIGQLISNNKNFAHFWFYKIYISLLLLFQNYNSINTSHFNCHLIQSWSSNLNHIFIEDFFCNFQFSASVFVKALQQMQILVGCQQTPFHWNMLLNEANPLQCIDSLHDWTSKPHNSLLPDFFLHLSLYIQGVFFLTETFR